MSIRESYPFRFLGRENNTLSFALENSDILARVFVLEEDIIRLLITNGELLQMANTWLVAPGMDDIPMEGRNRLDLGPFTLPEFTAREETAGFVVETGKLRLQINLNGFLCQWFYKDADGSNVHLMSDRKTQAYNFEGELGKGIYHYIARKRHEAYYGLGEKTGNTNRYGQRYRMLNIDSMGYDAEHSDPLYKHIPFYITRDEETKVAFGLFYDNMSRSVFDMGKELDYYHGHFRYFQSDAGDLDYYLIAGPRISDIVKRYSWLTGKTIFPPKWTLGYSGSTMAYTDAPNAQERLNEFLELCEKNDIICNSFQLSSGYSSINNKRCVFTWNRGKFPSPKEFVKGFHAKNVKLCANIKPCMLREHPLFEELKEKGLFIKNKAGEPEMVQFWDGIGAYPDFTNIKTITWWKQKVTEMLLVYGIDSTWNDNNEYEIWSKHEVLCNGFGSQTAFELTRALQPLLMMKASCEAQKEYAPEKRPYLISRSGAPGMQRYVQTWSGDNYTDWKTIKYNNKMAVGLSLSGIYNIGHDVGGFAGAAPEPELFVRWVQNGIFYPRFTIHSWNDDGTVNAPWMHEETKETIRDLIKFRQRLTPYLYTALYKAHKTYEPMLKPTFYDFDDDEKTFQENYDFMLGFSILVTSVVEKGATEREVYLPRHKAGWYDYNTSKWYESGQIVTIPAPLTYAPFLVKEGSIIPVNDADCTFLTKEKDERGFELFPHRGAGEVSCELFEDDGTCSDFSNNCAKIKVLMKSTSDSIEVDINIAKEGRYELPYDKISFYLPKDEKRALFVNGKQAQKQANGNYILAL